MLVSSSLRVLIPKGIRRSCFLVGRKSHPHQDPQQHVPPFAQKSGREEGQQSRTKWIRESIGGVASTNNPRVSLDLATSRKREHDQNMGQGREREGTEREQREHHPDTPVGALVQQAPRPTLT